MSPKALPLTEGMEVLLRRLRTGHTLLQTLAGRYELRTPEGQLEKGVLHANHVRGLTARGLLASTGRAHTGPGVAGRRVKLFGFALTRAGLEHPLPTSTEANA